MANFVKTYPPALTTLLFIFCAAVSPVGGSVKEGVEYLSIDNGYLSWGVPVSGACRSNRLMRFPGTENPEVGKQDGLCGQILIPCGFLPSAIGGEAHQDKSYYMFSDLLRQTYRICADNAHLTEVELKWELPKHECAVTYTTYNGDNKIFMHLEYVAKSAEINSWSQAVFEGFAPVTLFSIDASPANCWIKKTFLTGNGRIEEYYDCPALKSGMWYVGYNYDTKYAKKRIDWFAVTSLEYKRGVGVVFSPSTQSDNLLWYVQDEPGNGNGVRLVSGLRRPIVPYERYSCYLILVVDADSSPEMVRNVDKAFNVNGKLKGEFVRIRSSVEGVDLFKWSNPEGAKNLKVVGGIELGSLSSNNVAEVRSGETADYGASVENLDWWLCDARLRFAARIRNELYVFIKHGK